MERLQKAPAGSSVLTFSVTMPKISAEELTILRLGLLRDAIMMFKLATDAMPEALEDLLPTNAIDSPIPKGVLPDDPELLTDGWGRRIRFKAERPWELRSAGSGGTMEDDDDIVFPRDDIRFPAR